MKKTTKFLSLFALVLCLVMALSVTASAAEVTVVDGGTWGGIDWTFTSDGTFTVAPTKGTPEPANNGKTYEVGVWRESVKYNPLAYATEPYAPYASQVTKLVIEEGVTHIGSFAADDMVNLTGEVVIPSTVNYIGQCAFHSCSITKLTFAPGGTESLCIGVQSFKKNDFEEVILPADRPVVDVHTWTFEDCDKLKVVVFPANVTFNPYNHLDYIDPASVSSWDSQILARCWDLETVAFGSEEVQKKFEAGTNNTNNINAIRKEAEAEGRILNYGVYAAVVGTTGYKTFAEAVAAAQDGDTITLLAPVVITEDTTLKNIKVNGNSMYPAFRVQNGATLTVKNCTIYNPTDYVFVLGAADGSSAGNVVIDGGSYKGMTTLASVTKGELTIKGGDFSMYDSEYGAAYMLNCVDANYKTGDAKIVVTGGTFNGFNPKNNAAEGAGTNFVAAGHRADEADDTYTVAFGIAQSVGKKYASLEEAFAAAKSGALIKLLSDAEGNGIVIDKDIIIDFNGYSYTFTGNAVGSSNTKTNGFQILKGNTVELRNGTLQVADSAASKFAMLIQNYGNLGLTAMTLDGTNLDYSSKTSYTLSINSGKVTIKGTEKNTIIANDRGLDADYAWDVYDYSSAGYALPTLVVNSGAKLVTEGKTLAAAYVKSGKVTYFATLEQAQANADGKTITLLAPVVITEDTTLTGITVDGNGVYPAFRVQNGATLTLNDCNIYNATDYVFTLGAADESTAGNVIINSGSYKGMTTIASVTKGELTINGGKFSMYDSKYGAAYMLNCYDANYKTGDAKIVVKGGTFEGFNPYNNAAEGENTNFCEAGYSATEEDGAYTVVGAVAQIGNKVYGTFAEAVAAAKTGDTIILLTTVKVTENTTLDLTGINVVSSEGMYDIFDIRNGATLTIKGGSFDSTPSDCYVFYIGSTSKGAGHVVINGGTFHGACSVAQVNVGTLTINGGNFSATPSDADGSYQYLINCKDSTRDQCTVSIKGGTFANFNPANNAAEGEKTNFCAYGYRADEKDGTYTVVFGVAQSVGKKYASLEEAFAAAKSGALIKLLSDAEGNGIVIDKDIIIDFNGYSYTFTGNAVGSSNTKTNGFQILKGNTVELRNGTLQVADSAASKFAMLIQNYGNLGLTAMTLDGTNLDYSSKTSYTLSINSGKVTIKGTEKNTIIANDRGLDADYAWDVYDYSSAGYALPTLVVNSGAKLVTEGKTLAAAYVKSGKVTYFATVEQAQANAGGKTVTVIE